MVRSWLVEGIVVPLEVQSGSMALALVGPHREAVCGRCALSYVVGTDRGPLPARVFCPVCAERIALADSVTLPGDRVLLDKVSLSLRTPRRWEPVAFRHAQRSGDVFVKRIVGLPGEAVLVRDGDLYVDGRLQRKTLAEQRALAVPVEGASSAPAPGSGVPLRWQGRAADDSWTVERGRLVRASPGKNAIDWCEYRHLRARADGYQEAPIDDQLPYNQAVPRRQEEIHAVTDLLFRARVKVSGAGWLHVEMTDGRRRFAVRLDAEHQRYQTVADGRPAATGEIAVSVDRPFELEASLVDQQFLVAVDGRTLFAHLYERESPARPSSRPVAIGADLGLRAEIDRIRLERDLYYTRPTGLLGRWGVDKPYRLGADEYFVLGDNSPVSDDSRSWPAGPGVPGHLLVGRPLAACPTAASGWWGWPVQLPAPWRMRYIR